MTVDKWWQTVCDIASAAQSKGADAFEARNLIFGLWTAFMDAPSQVHTAFRSIRADILDAQVQRYWELICSGSNLPSVGTSLSEKVGHAAFLLRALEATFLQADGYSHPRAADELHVEYDGKGGFLIPFKPRFREGVEWPSHFQRRGLMGSRCIPTQLDTGEHVKLVLTDQLFPTDSLLCGAEFFDAPVALDSGGQPIDFATVGKFVFHGLSTKVDPVMQKRMEKACAPESPCDIVVFPELMMPDDWLNELRLALSERPWDPELKNSRPMLVVAGSWHKMRGDQKFENRAPLLDGFGAVVGEHRKAMPYTNEKLAEDIDPSNEILVVISPKLSIAVGICLDFCQSVQPKNPYDELDVDLVLVPSMGEDETMNGHAVKAKQIWDKRKTATFVVQQYEKKAFGYMASMPFPEGASFSEKQNNTAGQRKINRQT